MFLFSNHNIFAVWEKIQNEIWVLMHVSIKLNRWFSFKTPFPNAPPQIIKKR